MYKGDNYTIAYAVAMCLVCSLLLAITAASLSSRQQANAEVARQRHVLSVFGRQIDEPDEIQRISDEHIELIDVSAEAGVEEPMPLYRWIENGEISSYAFPIQGRGAWSVLRGYLALEDDLATIRGITFYDHQETPGLGAQIDSREFKEQFQGKVVFEDGELQRMRVVKGRVQDLYPEGNKQAVDGITGATTTGNGVERLLNEALRRYEAYFATLREER